MTHQDDIALLPSPFCGGNPSINQIARNRVQIKCTRCFVERTQRCLHYSVEWLSQEMARKWNTRALTPPTDEERADALFNLNAIEMAFNLLPTKSEVEIKLFGDGKPMRDATFANVRSFIERAALTQPARLPVIAGLDEAIKNISDAEGATWVQLNKKDVCDLVILLQAARAYQAASMGQPQSQWQDISTAPKDGTRVLLLLKGGKQCVARIEHHLFDGPIWVIYGEMGKPNCWCLAEEENDTRATHWMPLPEPPSADDRR